jgi:hypothetical protein
VFTFSSATKVRVERIVKMAEERRPRVQFLSDMKVKVHIHKESPIDALQEAVAVIKRFAVA